jgi:hypothetical protein
VVTSTIGGANPYLLLITRRLWKRLQAGAIR